MQRDRKLKEATLLVAALVASLVFLGTAQAQSERPAYVGKFTLAQQIHWGTDVLQPGSYTITIKSLGAPIIALIRNGDGDAITHVVSGASSGPAKDVNALLIKEKNGQLTVHSLALADLGMILIYDPSLARQAIREARASQSVPVMWAKE